jgi:hypothetical protein
MEDAASPGPLFIALVDALRAAPSPRISHRRLKGLGVPARRPFNPCNMP